MILLFILIISIYFIVLMKFTNSIYYYKDSDIKQDYNPNISIIISARNEEKNIKRTLESLIKQDYPNSTEAKNIDAFISKAVASNQ